MAEFRKERVLFHVVGQGSLEVEYEVGAETPEQAFRRAYDSNHGRPHRVREFDLRNLILEAESFEWVITVATEPTDEQMGEKCDKRQFWAGFSVPCGLLLGHEGRCKGTKEIAEDARRDYMEWSAQTGRDTDDLDRERELERERDDIEHTRAREDEDDQWRMNRMGSD